MKSFFFTLHKYLGLFTGIIIFIEALTGCIYCFQDELRDYFFKESRIVEVQPYQPFLKPSQLSEIALGQIKGARLNRVIYAGENRSATVMLLDEKKVMQFVYLNPYNGEVLKVQSIYADFFYIILYLHTTLLLPGTIGKTVIGVSSILFLIILISGLYMWWPKGNRFNNSLFVIKSTNNRKRRNYDLHRILGIYVSLLALVMVITGLSFAFEPVKKGLYTIINRGQVVTSELTKAQFIPETIDHQLMQLEADSAYAYAKEHSPNADMYWVYFPQENKMPVAVRVYHKSMRYASVDEYQFMFGEQKTFAQMDEKITAGKKFNNMTYDLHTGQLFGMVGKIIFFLASAIIGSLPITGFLIYRGRKRKTLKLTLS